MRARRVLQVAEAVVGTSVGAADALVRVTHDVATRLAALHALWRPLLVVDAVLVGVAGHRRAARCKNDARSAIRRRTDGQRRKRCRRTRVGRTICFAPYRNRTSLYGTPTTRGGTIPEITMRYVSRYLSRDTTRITILH